MTQEQSSYLQKKYDRLLEKVGKMRGYQKAFFKYHASADKEHSKRLEREVDQLLLDAVKEQKAKQQEIF